MSSASWRGWARLLLASVALSGSILASTRVSISADKAFQYAPGSVKLKVQIEPHKDNRLACLEWDSDEGSAGRSCWEVDGAESPRTSWRKLEHLPPGHYVVAAVVYEADGKSFVASAFFDVLSSR